MVIVIDDFLTLPLSFAGVDILPPNMLMLVFKSIWGKSLEETYPLGKINDSIKENRLLYEFGEIEREEYEKKNKTLMERLRIAKKVREMDLGTKINVLNA